MAKHKLSQHDVYVRQLVLILREKYDRIYTHVVVRCAKRRLGEIDIYAERGNEIDLFEVKCSFRITKARKQLSRMTRLLKGRHTNIFFYHGGSGTMVQLEPMLSQKGPPPRGLELVLSEQERLAEPLLAETL